METGGEQRQVLEEADLEVVVNPFTRFLTEEEMAQFVKGIDALIVGLEPVTRRVIEAADRLKVISKFGVGVDNINLEAAKERGIVVTFTPSVDQNSVAELVIGFIFCLARELPQMNERIKKGVWHRSMGIEITGKTLGIVGLGRVGKEVARRAVGLEMKVIAYDKHPDEIFAQKYNIAYRELSELFQHSDFISLHLPLTFETKKLVNKELLSLMKKEAYLINTARAELVDEVALYQLLQAEEIAGAAFDVLSEESPFDLPLLKLDNLIVSGRVGSRTKEVIKRQALRSAENVIAILRGESYKAAIVKI